MRVLFLAVYLVLHSMIMDVRLMLLDAAGVKTHEYPLGTILAENMR